MRYRAACVLAGVILGLAGVSRAAELTARKKAPVPDATAQDASRKALAAVYSVRFKDAQTDTAKSALAKELVAAAEDVPVGSSDQFVLLKIGCTIAAGAGDAATVMAAVIGLERHFDMPLDKLAAESLLTAAGRATGYSRHKDVAEAALFVADLVGDAGDYEMALKLCEVGRSSAKEARQHKLGDQFLAKVEELKREQKEFEKYREAIGRLKREPHDPVANLAAGRYLCFVIGDWDEGLTMLALGADAELKSAALEDLRGGGGAAEKQLAIGYLWWDLAEKEAVLAKERFQERAAEWYAVALPNLTGLAKAKAAKRLLEVYPDYVHGTMRATMSATEPAGRVPEVPAALTNSIGMKFVLIPPGEFLMGSPPGDSDAQAEEKPQHKVEISKAFYLGVTEVTQEQYERVMGENPSKFKGDPQRPVEQVSWDDAVAFCRKLSEKEGRTYRLPTEAEWEYACRAGSQTKWSFGDDASALKDYAWSGDNAGGTTHAVAQNKPNAWGLYDMHGNVWEWCQDRYASEEYRRFASQAAVDPRDPDEATVRVLRGGSWRDIGRNCRSGCRNRAGPEARSLAFAFRVARSVSD